MDTTLQFADADRNYKLSSAILIYGDAEKHVAATVHDVEHIANSQPIIKPGQPVSVSALERLMLSLGKANGASLLPPNILSLGLDRMAWWCAGGRRRIWFKTYKDEKDGPVATLKQLNGKFVHHPPLLFVVKNGLNVWALTADQRPTAETKLQRAPYWNLTDGHMCNGNLVLPACQPENIPQFEAAFFNSAFTHGVGEGVTHHKGGQAGMWLELSKRKSKPDSTYWKRNLIGAQKTLKSAVA